jgi:GTPase
VEKPYQRYLLGAVRDSMNFEEVPIKLYLRRRQPSDNRDDVDATLPAPGGAEGDVEVRAD